MISDFTLLSQKIGQLAELAQTLRRENADLRLAISALEVDNGDLASRMAQAHERVAALLANLPELADADDADDDAEEAA